MAQVLKDIYFPAVQEQLLENMNKPTAISSLMKGHPELAGSVSCPHVNWSHARDECADCGMTGKMIYNQGGSMDGSAYNFVGPKRKPSFGRLVRIPIYDSYGNLTGARDVTEQEARKVAKRYRKAVRRIEKIIGS